ncbi:MAG: hypothetical protein R2862_06225 [Thermoanaerobaculia bacterium]
MRKIDELQGLWNGVDFAADPAVRLLQQYVGIDTSEPDADELGSPLPRRPARRGRPDPAHRTCRGAPRQRLGLRRRRGSEGDRALRTHRRRAGGRAGGLAFSTFQRRDRRPLDLRPRDVRHEESGDRPAPRHDRRRAERAQTEALDPVPPDLRRGGEQRHRGALDPASASGARRADGVRPHRRRRGRSHLVQDVKYWGIEFAQKRFANLTFCSDRRERLDDLQKLLNETGKPDPDPNVAPAVADFLRHYASTRGLGNYRALLAQPERTIRRRSDYDQLSNFMQALFRNEIVAFPPEESAAGGFSMRVAVHLLPDAELEPVLAELVPAWKTGGLTYVLQRDIGSRTASPIDTPLFAQLVRAIEEAHPGVPVGPYFLPWAATDSRFYRERGIPSYGYSPFLLTVTETMQTGRPNERMQLPGYLRGVELYRKLIRELAG